MVHPALWLPAPLAVGITPRSAHLLALLFTSSYVGSLYLAQNIFLDRPSRASDVPVSQTTTATTSPAPISAGSGDPNRPEVGSRDHPETIKIRMKAVMGATAASLAGVLWTVKNVGSYSWLGAVSISDSCHQWPLVDQVDKTSVVSLGTSLCNHYPDCAGVYAIPARSSLDVWSSRSKLPRRRPTFPTTGFWRPRGQDQENLELVDSCRHKKFRRRTSPRPCPPIISSPDSTGPIDGRASLPIDYPSGVYHGRLVNQEPCFRHAAMVWDRSANLPSEVEHMTDPTAHAHHAWDAFRRNGGDSDAAKRAVATSGKYINWNAYQGVAHLLPVFQLGYTTLFGWFAAYLYLRTGKSDFSHLSTRFETISDLRSGSVIAPAVSHIFCNYMGIYLPTTAARRHPKKSLSQYPLLKSSLRSLAFHDSYADEYSPLEQLRVGHCCFRSRSTPPLNLRENLPP